MNITKHIKNSFSSNAIFSPNEVDIINDRVGIIKIHGCLVIGVILYGIDCQGSWDYFHRHDRWWAYPDDIEWVVPMFEHDVVDDFLYLDLVEFAVVAEVEVLCEATLDVACVFRLNYLLTPPVLAYFIWTLDFFYEFRFCSGSSKIQSLDLSSKQLWVKPCAFQVRINSPWR